MAAQQTARIAAPINEALTSRSSPGNGAARDLGLQYELEKVTDIRRYADFGAMVTPAMVVDGSVKVSGRVPSLDEAGRLLG